MNRPQPPPANGPGRWAVGACLAVLLAAGAAAQTVELRQTSVPVGIINQTTSVTMNTVASTVTAPETSGAYTFCYWTLNAVRWSDLSGGAQNPARYTVAGAVDAVAIYLPSADDTDSDSLPDWWENRYFGNLSETGSTNPDGDAYPNSEEFAKGHHPRVHNLPDHGGLSRRRWIASVIQDPVRFVRLTELSEPAGVILQSRIVPKGAAVTLANPPASTAGYYFTGWMLNGARFDRPADWQPISVTPMVDTTLVARYILETVDSDGDDLPDWKEWLWFDGLQYDKNSDPDGDGYTIAEEQQRGFTSLAPDLLANGGISRRRAAPIYVDFTGQLPFRLASDPATILDQLSYHPTGLRITVPSKEGHASGGYQFTWWDLNGTRQQDASGAALPGFAFTLNAPSTATAHYIDPNIDTDGDGIKDWNEWTYFGSLIHDAESDPDHDGFSYAAELARGQGPQVADLLSHGSVSRRRSSPVFVSRIGHLSFRTTSDPATILNDQQFLLPGTLVTVADKTGHTYASHVFTWWDRNGIRQEDASGVALGGFKFTIDTPTQLVGHYMDPTIDSDGDGIKDWHEWTYCGTLAYDQASDTDADSFSYADEIARSQSPRVLDVLEPGGVSRRRGALVTIDPVVLAGPPEVGELQATDITATTATISAHINALSSATTANFQFGTTPAFGQIVASVSILNGFIADSMSAPLTGLLPDTLYYYRVNATNSNGTTTSATATFRTAGSRSNYQQWALIYSIADPYGDEDGDGVGNLVEYAFGMNPRTASDLWKMPEIELIGGRFRLSVTAPQDVTDVIYGAEWSLNMEGWTAIADSGGGAYHEFWTPVALIGEARVFVRWAVRLAP
jgi:hypothetical protein